MEQTGKYPLQIDENNFDLNQFYFESWLGIYKKDMENLENFIRFLQKVKLEWNDIITQVLKYNMLITERNYVRTKERILRKIENFAKHEKEDIDFYKDGFYFDNIYV